MLGLHGCGTEESPPPFDPAALPATPTDPTDEAWADVRSLFILEPGTAYMNNASLGMPPGMVADAVAAGYRAISTEPLHGKHDLQDRIAQQVIPGLAAILGVEPSELSLTRNAT